jgi:hypothetical protein
MSTARVPDPSLRSGDLAAEVVQDVQRLVSLEIELAKQEVRELAVTNAIAVICFAAAAFLFLLALLVALPVMVVMLLPWHWEAALVWAAGYALVAAVVALIGKAKLRIGLPQKTITSLKETKAWALQRMRSTGR